MERVSRLISYEQQTQVTPFPVLSLSVFSWLRPPLRLFPLYLSFPLLSPPSLFSLTGPANCETVVQHAHQTASQHAGPSPIMRNHNRQKGVHADN